MENLKETLLLWHKSINRPYPWRMNISPYRVMIAEFMLQRTRSDQVVSVYKKFLNKYPHLEDLADADIEEVRYLLKPLGLYWRADHFKKAAQYIINEFKGIIPGDREKLLKIPGVGDYAAGAILAVVFSKKIPIVDSNIARVLNRYYGLGLKGEVRRNKQINELSEELFDCDDPKEMLFCIIDFSALICTPLNPKHNICPLEKQCRFNLELKEQSS